MSLISLKWTVREETKKQKPREKTNCVKITNGRKSKKMVYVFPKMRTKMKRIGRPKRK
jgi:hypothetical protein